MTASRVSEPPVRTPSPGTARADTIGRGGPPAATDGETAADGGLWRGPTEGHWIARLLHGAPAPRDPTPPPAGRTPPD
jgi:hypothetical protein